MRAGNNIHTVSFFDLLAMDGGEQFFESIANSFVSKNADVEQFFREKAVQATKLNTAATYLVISYEEKNFDLLGYFDEDTQSYKLPAVLIAQFSRNFSENSKSISGSELMDIALDKIRDILHSTSGKAVFLECEQSEKIIDFYTRHNFQPLGNTVFSKDNKELTQLYMIL